MEGRQKQGAELEVLAAGIADDADQLDSATVVRVALVEYVFPLADALGNTLEGVFQAVADLFFEEVPLEGAQALDLFDGFVVPAAQGGAGDVQLGGDSVEGEALGAEFDELVFGFEGMHRLVEG